MKVALIQMNSGSDKAANLEQARGLIEQSVREEKPDWVCLPEVFDFMGGSLRDKQAAAEKLPDGPAYSMMRDLAKKHRIPLVPFLFHGFGEHREFFLADGIHPNVQAQEKILENVWPTLKGMLR